MPYLWKLESGDGVGRKRVIVITRFRMWGRSVPIACYGVGKEKGTKNALTVREKNYSVKWRQGMEVALGVEGRQPRQRKGTLKTPFEAVDPGPRQTPALPLPSLSPSAGLSEHFHTPPGCPVSGPGRQLLPPSTAFKARASCYSMFLSKTCCQPFFYELLLLSSCCLSPLTWWHTWGQFATQQLKTAGIRDHLPVQYK